MNVKINYKACFADTEELKYDFAKKIQLERVKKNLLAVDDQI